MRQLVALYRSTVGKKIIMAVTGAILIGFLVMHVVGNLLALAGPAKINAYSAFLHSTGELLWVARGVLLVSLILHVIAAAQLTLLDRAARPVGYAKKEAQAATLASRTMRWGGVLLLAFIIYHLLHFTIGSVHPDFVEGDPYHNIVTGFQQHPLVAGFYLLAMAGVGLHLYHGGSAMFNSLGLNHPSWNPGRQRLMRTLAALVALGFATIPLAVLAGVIK
ncbi:MAG TPA: succinate dehydrogenase cytochrome b subunit [Gemmatimonadales bacterium]|nr:succinate dehydrogenase cytochrome b subunit [Gemmatimonadales bacterium]